MRDDSLISIIMGIYYKKADLTFLKRAIESILYQTHENLELIICERDSTSEAKEYISNISVQDKRVILIDGSNTQSFSEQLNLCLKAANGNWIARMDDDDYSFPERLEMQLEYLHKHEEIAFVGCNVNLIQDGAEIGIQTFPEKPQVEDFLFVMPFIHPALLFRKAALTAVNGYSELSRCNKCEDYDLLLRMYEAGMFGANIQTIYFAYTLPPKGLTPRNFQDRINEMKTRFARFSALNLFPKAFPYAIKPIIVWLLPKKLLAKLKNIKIVQENSKNE